MKIFTKIFTAIVIVLAFCNNATSQSISNKGKDFWVGYGYHQYMANGDGGNNGQDMTIYLGVEDLPAGKTYATVTVEIDSSGGATNASQWWRRVYHIPANTAISVATYNAFSFSTAATGITGAMPKTGIYNCALFDGSANCPNPERVQGFGLFRGRGIHIMSDVDITAYAHIYAITNSGATMLLPTPSWGYSYTTINSKQATAQLANNFFYIVAQEDSTVVKITPSNFPQPYACVNGSVAPLTPYTITLHKGWIYQYLGKLDATTTHLDGVDLTGSKIQSIPNAEGKCKKIAVFAGSGRTVGESAGGACAEVGRDNDMQQCFPQHTWGDDYLTSPFATSNGSSSLNACAGTNCTYKIVAQDTGTIVTVSGTTNDGSFPVPPLGFLYRASNQPCRFTSNKPIAVGQFMSSDNCSGDGDPEMIYQSPIAQAITGVSFYRQDETNIFSNFVTIILPDSGLNKLKIYDGFTNKTDTVKNNLIGANSCIKPHPRYPGYKIVTKGWAAAKGMVSISSNARFNAFTYGLGGAESYGYSGGTFLNNLAADSRVRNIYDTINNLQDSGLKFNGYVYSHSPVELKTSITYTPRKIEWLFDYLKNHPELMDTNKVLLKRVCDNVMFDRQVDTQRAYVYMPPFQYLGYDTFYVKGCSGTGACTTQMHIVKVGCPMAANTQTKYVVKTAALPPPTDSGRAAIDFAPTCGNPSYTYSCVDAYGNPTVPANRSAKKGVVTVIANSGAYQYISPTAATFNGKDTFYIKICDNGGVAPTTCFIKMYVVTVGNQFTADTVVIPNGVTMNIPITYSAITELNATGGKVPYSYSIVNQSGVGTATSAVGASVTIVAGNYTYTPQTGFTGKDSFYIKVCDANSPNSCLIQKHVVTVGAAFTANSNNVNVSTTLNTKLVTYASANSNVNGGVGGYVYTIVNGAGVATATSNKGCAITVKNNNGIVTYTPTTGLLGSDTFYIKTCDGSVTPNCTTQMYIVTINNSFTGNNTAITNQYTNNAGSVTDTASSTHEINPQGGSAPYTYSVVNSAQNLNGNKSSSGGNIVINASTGLYTYTPLSTYVGVDTFYIRVSDASNPANVIIQPHYVSVYSSIIGNSLPFIHNLGKDGQLYGNLLLDMPGLPKTSQTVFSPVNASGNYRDSSNRKGNVYMMPLPIDTIHDAVKGDRYVYKALPTYIPPCNYVFIQKDITYPHIDSVYVPIVIYSTPKTGIPQGCYGAGGLIGDTINLLYIIYPPLKIDSTDFLVVKPVCPSDSTISFMGKDSSKPINLNQKIFIQPVIKHLWKISGTYQGQAFTATFTTKNCSLKFDRNSTVCYTYISVFYNGAIDSFVNCFVFNPFKLAMQTTPHRVCLGQSIAVKDITLAKDSLYNYSWNFGDNTPLIISKGKDTTHSYTDTGYFYISHTVTVAGCADTIPRIYDTVYVAAKRFPTFIYPTNCIDTSGTANFWYDSSKGGVPIKYYSWHFGEPSSGFLDSSLINPTSHTYAIEDSFHVQLHVEDTSGCKGDTTMTVPIHIMPHLYFNAITPNAICINTQQVISFSGLAGCLNIPKVQGTGIFKGPGTDAAGNFNPKTAKAGTHQIWYIYTSKGGCMDSVSQFITVNDTAAIDFDYNPKGACLPKDGVVKFTNLSVGGFSFTWTFDDATNATANNPNVVDSLSPSHKFCNSAMHNVKLMIETSMGCKDSIIKPLQFTVMPDIKADTIKSECEGKDSILIKFANIQNCVSSGFGTYSGIGVNPSSGYLHPAAFGYGYDTIKYVYDNNGCVDSAIQTVLIKARPRIHISYPIGCLPASGIVQFTDTSNVPDGQTIASCFWDFGHSSVGNPKTSTSCSPQHTYPYGPVVIYHSVNSSLGCFADTTINDTFRVSPSLYYNAIPAVCENLTTHSVAYAGSNNLAAVPGYGYYSGFGVIDTANGTINPSLMGAGTFAIKYTFKATSNCTLDTVQNVTIKARPKGQFTFTPNTGCLPATGTVNFDATAITVQGSTITSYNWLFENGSSSGTGATPSHNYSDGTYAISLNVKAANGCEQDTAMTQTFNKSPLLSPLVINDTCENITAFSLVAIGKEPSVLNGVTGTGSWSDSKGAITNTANGTIDPTIAGYGIDTITYTFTTASCKSFVKGTINFKAHPRGTFTYTPQGVCLDTAGTVNFDATAIAVQGSTITSYNWLFENGSSAGTGATPSHNYSDGTYAISLNVKAANGCEQDTAMTQTFSKSPSLSPLVINDTCENITAFSLVAIGKEPSVLNGVTGTGSWSDSKGAITNTANGTIDPTIAGYGIDTITYTFTTASCKSFVKGTINFKAHPRGTFTYTPQGVCLDTAGTVNFDASSIIVPNSSVASYTWDFGNTKTGTGVMPSSNYNEGTYTITLTTQGANGCSSDTSLTTTFTKMPHLDTITLAYICSNGGTTNVIPPAVLNGVTGTGTFSSTKGAVTSTGVYDPAIAGYGVDTITYTFTSTGGCVATTKFAATVKSRPTGTFTYTPLGVCLDTAGTVTFNASSFTAPLANITTYTWDFGNIKTGTGVTPSTNYFNDGTYLIKLRVDADNGCWFDTAMSATFNKTPHLAAMPSISLCENGGVDTIKPAVVLNGALGTGVFSSYKNAITNATLGIYDPSISACGVDTVYYTYTSPGLGCSATEKMIVNVLCRPTGTFVYAPNNSCLNTAGTVNFTGNIVVPNSSVLSCIYDFGDLTTGSGLNATHNYNDGTYTIKLTTQGANGCSFDTSLTATFSKTPLLANLQQGDTCENIGIITLRAPQVLNGVAGTGVFTSYKNAVTNAATGTYDPSIAGYGVDTIYYTYTSASAASCSVTQKLAFRVLARPTGTFVYAPNNNCLNAAGTVNFTGNITVPNSSVQSAIYTFGDGDSLSGLNVAHNYNEGTFTIKLDIAGANGCKFDTSLTATFSKQPSLGAFTHVPICENKGLDTFTAAIVTNNVVLRDSAFHSTKGAFVDSVRGIYDPSIAGYGTDTITYTATSKGGCSTTKTLYLQVKARPRGTFVFTPPTGCLDASGLVKFNAINIKVPNSYVQTYNWQFEAPSSPILSAGVNPTHNYADGVYDIKLNVIGANACSFDTMINQAFNRTPSLDPIQSPNVCASGAPFLLSAPAVNNGVAGTGVFTSYKNAVSGNVATGFYYNPAVGNYIVDTLYYTYTANSSCSTTVKKAIHINPVPKVKIKSPNNVCIDSMATITDASTLLSGNIVYRTWEIVGDSTFTFTNINTPVIWQFDSAKTYTVKLTVTSDSLCSASDSVSITVRPKPVASFNVSNTVCMPNGTVFFTNTSTISANNGTLNYLWNFGDPSAIGNNGNTAHTPNAQHIYSTIQNYPVSLRVTSQPFGCVSIFNDTLKPQDPFFAKPVAKFEISKDTLCENETTTFIDTLSTAPGSKLFSWTWDYGNGTTPSTTTSFYSVYAYPKAGNFIATLKVRNTELCESAPYSLPVKVYPTPTITKMPKIYALDGTMVQFTPIVKDSSNASYLWTAPQPYGVAGLDFIDIKNPHLTVTQVQPAGGSNASQYYTLYTYGATGCNDTATQEVVVLGKLHIPNAFSPNGDGRNDKWVLTSLGDYPNATVDIFDRYGNKVMHLNAGQMEWDGTMNGTPAPVATYYYIIQPGYGLPQVSGWVVLLR